MDASERFEEVHDELIGEPGVDEGTGFGKSPGLRVGGKIFAMLVHGEFVAKLPPERCDALVASGASRLRVGKREMREWVTLDPASDEDWPDLAREALAFVRDA